MTDYVYGDVDGALILILKERAEQLSILRSDFATWGDAKRNLSPDTWAGVVERFDAGEADVPADDEPYDLDAVPGHADGDWPAWPARDMLRDVPTSVREKFGRVEDSVHNGSYLHLDAADEDEILEALRRHGWTCTRDDLLVEKASGF
ncbi:hypothetical protein [Rhodococcoides corynebacterioides]|uniref:Uncharacterized protein n=1 Tax=Rhodococcoides corynebacterioides TaxID=53972 RepID=A0ABS7P2A5_9NOCA|nr:hypothetical protein [Rhodococcus corynebacterioides]MBY6366544.1 hypothetical protein [Rhodococcus corynebacterioides]MBY6408087.1 hypothetical protein [Rhodococcus corynebacterioides]